MAQPFFCMAILQFIGLAVSFFRDGPFLHLLVIYSAFDICCGVLFFTHWRIRHSRPVLSRTSKIVVVLSPLYMPLLVLAVWRYLH